MSTLLPPDPIQNPNNVGSQGLVERGPRTKGEVFKILNQELPLNEYGCPDYIYRADLVPSNIFEYSSRDRSQILESAAIEITFFHGYPAVEETTPFWEQLPCEGTEAYNAFVTYLEMPEKSQAENPIRLLPMLSSLLERPIEELSAWAHMYYWHFRGRAYDLFLVACHRKQREQRLMTMEGKHFREAEAHLQKVNKIANHKFDTIMRAIASGEADESAELDEVKLKDLIDMMERLVKIQRISVGLSASNSTTNNNISITPHASPNDSLKEIAAESTHKQKESRRSAEMDALLENPDDLVQIQDLMTRLANSGSRGDKDA